MLCCGLLFGVLILACSNFSVTFCVEISTNSCTDNSDPLHEIKATEPRTFLIVSDATREPSNEIHPLLVPRGDKQNQSVEIPDKWRQNIELVLSSGQLPFEKLDPKEIPGIFRKIYSQCQSSTADGHPSDKQLTACIINGALETLPAKPYVKTVAKAVVSDLLNKKGQGFYTTKSVLGASALCNELQQTQGKGKPELELARCFLNSLIQMHPLKDYAVSALKKRANGFFDNVAKTCHDSMPKELKNRREINRYYLQCFIDVACSRYKNNILVKFGRKYLTYYIDHPDSVFNREKIIDIAEYCDDKTQGLPPDKKRSAAFFCFIRSLFSLHPRTKRLADYLIRWETTHPQQPESERRPSTGGSSTGRQSRSLIPMLSKSGTSSPKRESITDCMLRAVTSLPIANQALSAVTSLPIANQAISAVTSSVTSRLPKLFGRSLPMGPSGTDESALKPFIDAATPCFRFFRRDENGKLVLDQAYAAGAAVDMARMTPAGAFAIGAAEALAENVSVTTDDEGKTQYVTDYNGLGKALGMAVLKSTKLGSFATKFMK